MARDTILHRVRTALGRTANEPPPSPPPVYLRVPGWSVEERIRRFTDALEALGGQVHRAGGTASAHEIVQSILDGRSAVASADAGDSAQIREAASRATAGITGAAYALAETGTLVLFASPGEPRLVSLLPPVHIAVVPTSRLLTNLDELLSILPDPAAQSSAMVLITGPSRTADIEQILIRGVHGPGEVHVVLMDSETG